MADRTPHQDRIVKRYYDNRDAIMLNRLGELVSQTVRGINAHRNWVVERLAG